MTCLSVFAPRNNLADPLEFSINRGWASIRNEHTEKHTTHYTHTSETDRDQRGGRRREMEVSQVLHMNGGVGETSYANNSLVQVLPTSLYVYMYLHTTIYQCTFAWRLWVCVYIWSTYIHECAWFWSDRFSGDLDSLLGGLLATIVAGCFDEGSCSLHKAEPGGDSRERPFDA